MKVPPGFDWTVEKFDETTSSFIEVDSDLQCYTYTENKRFLRQFPDCELFIPSEAAPSSLNFFKLSAKNEYYRYKPIGLNSDPTQTISTSTLSLQVKSQRDSLFSLTTATGTTDFYFNMQYYNPSVGAK